MARILSGTLAGSFVLTLAGCPQHGSAGLAGSTSAIPAPAQNSGYLGFDGGGGALAAARVFAPAGTFTTAPGFRLDLGARPELQAGSDGASPLGATVVVGAAESLDPGKRVSLEIPLHAFGAPPGFKAGEEPATLYRFDAASDDWVSVDPHAYEVLPETASLAIATGHYGKFALLAVDPFKTHTRARSIQSHQEAFTFGIASYPDGLEPAEVRQAIASAFSSWAALVPGLRFEFREDAVDVGFRFEWRDLGSGKTIGQQDRRDITEQQHRLKKGQRMISFNSLRKWAIADPASPANSDEAGFDIESVALHEIGHALGMWHLDKLGCFGLLDSARGIDCSDYDQPPVMRPVLGHTVQRTLWERDAQAFQRAYPQGTVIAGKPLHILDWRNPGDLRVGSEGPPRFPDTLFPLLAEGGIRPYRWSLASGTLPPGLRLAGFESDDDGRIPSGLEINPRPPKHDRLAAAIWGKAETAGSYAFVLEVADLTGQTATRSFAVKVSEAGRGAAPEQEAPTGFDLGVIAQ